MNNSGFFASPMIVNSTRNVCLVNDTRVFVGAFFPQRREKKAMRDAASGAFDFTSFAFFRLAPFLIAPSPSRIFWGILGTFHLPPLLSFVTPRHVFNRFSGLFSLKFARA